MRKIILLVGPGLVFVFSGYAQSNSDSVYYSPIAKPIAKQKIKNEKAGESTRSIEYFFNVQSGVLVGCNDCGKGKEFTFSAATVNGITIGKKFRTGVGLGFDSYQNWQTLPLFGMASWDLIGSKNKNALFVQIAYGWAHPWFVRDGFYSNYTSDPFSIVKGGKMVNPQIGYRIKYYNLRLSMTVGYKFQRIFYKQPNYFYCPTCDFPQLSFDEVTHDMNRVQLVMSVGWK